MVSICVDNFVLKIFSEFKIKTRAMILSIKKLGHWMDGWIGGGESRVKDCLQQSKTLKLYQYDNILMFFPS